MQKYKAHHNIYVYHRHEECMYNNIISFSTQCPMCLLSVRLQIVLDHKEENEVIYNATLAWARASLNTHDA